MASVVERDSLPPANIISTLQSTSGLTTLNKYINGSTKLTKLLGSAQEFTFLAPSDTAFKTWLASQSTTPSLDVIEATLEYHLLNGSFPTVSITNTSQIAQTYLTNSSYSNVTISPPGQRVELVSDGEPVVLSNNKTVSTITSKDIICLGGLIQVVDTMLSIPTSVVLLSAEAKMSYFIALLNQANFLSVNDTGLVDFVNMASFTPNMTFFVPNSAAALAKFNNILTGMTADDLLALFDYHIIPDYVGYSPSLTNGTVLKSVQGTDVTITTQGSDTYVNSAKVISTNYFVVNGVIHLIDSLLDVNNTAIPSQTISSSTASPTATNLTTSTAAASSNHTNSHAAIAIGVTVPVVVIAIITSIAFWFIRKRRARKERQHELDISQSFNPGGELDAQALPKELQGGSRTFQLDTKEKPGELDSPAPAYQLDAKERPGELDSPLDRPQPAELE